MAGQNFLDRFRPVGAPGAAGAVGVPATDVLGPAVELAPVFAALAADLAACQTLVQEAERDAAAAVAKASDRATALVAEARLNTGADQARAAAHIVQTEAEADARVLAAAHARATSLGVAGDARLSVAAQRVLTTMLSEQLAAQ
ncbi:hypothetical protein [Cryobacterium sp. CG_9.6]|uniref:hypothetical protein n=1 Tax=Cryobacterium sp. CG_9.6 TaxID=2760710 RepID=UPI0024769A7E|nr:hypothetical protein [Cryobacterium sp. CG_9.6]MDH6235348.1 hypothetical protein [Cryobacterium sp. CG_9.6]